MFSASSVNYFIATDTLMNLYIASDGRNYPSTFIIYKYSKKCNLIDSIIVHSTNGIQDLEIDDQNCMIITSNSKRRFVFANIKDSIFLHEKKLENPYFNYDVAIDTYKLGDYQIKTVNKKIVVTADSIKIEIYIDDIVPFYTKILSVNKDNIFMKFGREGLFKYNLRTKSLVSVSKIYDNATEYLRWNFTSNFATKNIVGISNVSENTIEISTYTW